MKFKTWDGSDLKGLWEVSLKIDGVRAISKDGWNYSRDDKKLYNIPPLPPGDYEVYLGSWEKTVSAVRTIQGCAPIKREYIYSLTPIDPRLFLETVKDPAAKDITLMMNAAVMEGFEGLVLRNIKTDVHLKVKPVMTYDVPVIGVQMGKGKHTGKLGALLTEKGKVGTGFTDKQREELLDLPIGQIIEVECMQLTPAGKFRHPRFKRVRYDKGINDKEN